VLGGTIYLYDAIDVLQLAARQRQANPPVPAR
jgi:hypothetical protein